MWCFGSVRGWLWLVRQAIIPQTGERSKVRWAGPQIKSILEEEINSIILGWELAVLYSVPVAEVGVFFSTVIRLRVGGLGLHHAPLPPPTLPSFSIFETSIKIWTSHAMTASSWYVLLIDFNHFFSNKIMIKRENWKYAPAAGFCLFVC